MIHKRLITFDAHSQTGGTEDVTFVGEKLLTQKEPIEITNSFFCRLPFRLRLGSRAVFAIKGVVPARITVINSVDIPNAEVQGKLLTDPAHVPPQLASSALITLKPVKLKEDAKEAIVSFHRRGRRAGRGRGRALSSGGCRKAQKVQGFQYLSKILDIRKRSHLSAFFRTLSQYWNAQTAQDSSVAVHTMEKYFIK